MNTKHIALLLLLLVPACSWRNKPTKQGKWPEGVSPVTVHPKIDGRVRMAGDVVMNRDEEGRLEIRVMIENRGKKPITVIAYTNWMDRDGNVIEVSNDIPMVLPSGTTEPYEDKSWAARAELFSVSIRPANTKRRTR